MAKKLIPIIILAVIILNGCGGIVTPSDTKVSIVLLDSHMSLDKFDMDMDLLRLKQVIDDLDTGAPQYFVDKRVKDGLRVVYWDMYWTIFDIKNGLKPKEYLQGCFGRWKPVIEYAIMYFYYKKPGEIK